MNFTKNNSLPTDSYISNKSIFIWIDILGFSNAAEDEKKYEGLSDILKKFQNMFNEGNYYSSRIISDGIVLIVKKDISYDKLKEILQEIGEKQFNFILNKNHFIRGGIAVGTKLQNNNDNFISNGLTRSVKIESRYVDWPVIGTDKENIKQMRDIFSIPDDNEYFGLMHSYNNRGEDIYFIDFINDANRDDYYSLVNSMIEKFKLNSKIKNKYLWLLKYFRHKYGDSKFNEQFKKTVL